MNRHPRVHAVVMHCHGHGDLEECLRPLVDSSEIDLHVTVVLNGGASDQPDPTTGPHRVLWVRSDPHIGRAAAFNLGVATTNARLDEPDYWFFVDSQSRVQIDTLNLLVSTLRSHPNAAALAPSLICQRETGRLKTAGISVDQDGWAWHEMVTRAADHGSPAEDAPEVLAVPGVAMLVDSPTFGAVGGWEEFFELCYDDIDLCLKIRSTGRAVLVDMGAEVEYRLSAYPTSVSDPLRVELWRDRLTLAIIHWPATLLFRFLRTVIVEEVLSEGLGQTEVRRVAFTGALRRLPRLLRERLKRSGASRWRGMLHRVGAAADPRLSPRDDDGLGKPALPFSISTPLRPLVSTRDGGRRVLTVGCSPLPFENQKMNYAPGTRTWEVVSSMRSAGHDVCLVCSRITGAYDGNPPPVIQTEQDGVKVYLVDAELFRLAPSFAELADDFRADVVVGVSPTPSLQAIRTAGARPVWVDLFGDLMAEGQAREIVHGDPADLVASRDLLAELLARGDAFSAVSERQRLAVLGQLGLVGRLNAATADRQLVFTMPLAVGPTARRAPAQIDGIADRDFVVLWSGGFNTWCDVPTLVAGVDAAMDRHPAIRFLCTGAAIVGHDEDTYRTFLELVSRSRHRDRFTLLGCLPADEASSVHQRADLAVLTERAIPERMLGSSGRMGYWIESGIPFACTPVSEPGEELITAGGALGFEPGDVSGLSRRILDSADDPRLLRTVVRKARRFADQRWPPESAHRALLDWLRDPTCARDRLRSNPIDLSRLVHTDQELEAARTEIEQLQRAKHELDDIHRSWMWRGRAATILLGRGILRVLKTSPRTR